MDVIKTYDGKQLAAYSDVNGRRLELTIDDDNKVAAIGGRELAGSGGLATVSVDESLQGDGSAENPLGVAAPVDVVAGPGIIVDNPDGNTLRISMAKDDETVLWEGSSGAGTVTLSESRLNFDHVIFYVYDTSSNLASTVSLYADQNRTIWQAVNSTDYSSKTAQRDLRSCILEFNSDTVVDVAPYYSVLDGSNAGVSGAIKLLKVIGIRRLNGIGPSDTVGGLPVREYTAGPGVVIDPVDKTISASYSETVLWEGTAKSGSWNITLSESASNFDHLLIGWKADASSAQASMKYDIITNAGTFTLHDGFFAASSPYWFDTYHVIQIAADGMSITYSFGKRVGRNTTTLPNDSNTIAVFRVIGVRGVNGGK